MKIAIILNGISLEKEKFYKKTLPKLTSLFNVEVFETLTVNDAVSLASKAVIKRFDIILAAATLHHLRDDDDWELMFGKIYKALKPGGSFWISDFITHNSPTVTKLFEERYGNYLESMGGKEYQKKVLDYVNFEDTPRSLNYQLKLLAKVRFTNLDVLHKNLCFAAFGAVKGRV